MTVAQELDIKEIHELVLKIKIYLTPKEDWKPIDIAGALIRFERTHGTEKTRALGRFIKWAKANDKPDSFISVNLGHDLNGCDDSRMSPRTAGY